LYCGRYNAVFAYPQTIASYTISVRQYRILQSRFLQCPGHPGLPCGLLILPGVTQCIRDLHPLEEYTRLLMPFDSLFVFLNFFQTFETGARCSCRAHTACIINCLASSCESYHFGQHWCISIQNHFGNAIDHTRGRYRPF
jgi:hypothetical protein